MAKKAIICHWWGASFQTNLFEKNVLTLFCWGKNLFLNKTPNKRLPWILGECSSSLMSRPECLFVAYNISIMYMGGKSAQFLFLRKSNWDIESDSQRGQLGREAFVLAIIAGALSSQFQRWLSVTLSNLLSLCLSFSLCKMGIMIPTLPTSYGCYGDQWDNIDKYSCSEFWKIGAISIKDVLFLMI